MLTPKTEAELSDAIAGANAPLAVTGGGTRGLTPRGTPLHLSGLSGITLHEPGALTLVAGAGTPLSEIEAALAAEGQRLAFEPMDHCGLTGAQGAPTIGGVVAGNISGPRRIQAGACRDFLLGVRFVDGAGRIVKNGGRVMKNVTGYDLVKLMAGSWGTLGVLSEVSLKVLPAVETEATLVLSGLDPVHAVAAMSAALGSPYEVSGVAHRVEATPETLFRLEGFGDSVAYRCTALAGVLARFGAVSAPLEADASRAAWRAIRDAAPFHGTGGDVWRVSVKPSDGPAVLGAIAAPRAIMDWGGGLVWVEVPAGTDLRARLAGIAGHATLVRADPATRARLGTFQPEPAAVAALARGLKAQFDPRDILNRGLMHQTEEA